MFSISFISPNGCILVICSNANRIIKILILFSMNSIMHLISFLFFFTSVQDFSSSCVYDLYWYGLLFDFFCCIVFFLVFVQAHNVFWSSQLAFCIYIFSDLCVTFLAFHFFCIFSAFFHECISTILLIKTNNNNNKKRKLWKDERQNHQIAKEEHTNTPSIHGWNECTKSVWKMASDNQTK